MTQEVGKQITPIIKMASEVRKHITPINNKNDCTSCQVILNLATLLKSNPTSKITEPYNYKNFL